MGSITISKDVVPQLKQLVHVNGQRVDYLYCTGINKGTGLGGTTAEFAFPQARWDTLRTGLRGALVEVWYYNALTPPQAPDFVGLLDADSSEASPDSNGVRTISARTMTAYLADACVGQTQSTPVVNYWVSNPLNPSSSDWTPKRVLEDLLDNLPSNYKPYVGLGDTRVIDTSAATFQANITFRNQTYEQACQQLMDYFGDVSCRERFWSGAAVIDFFRIQDQLQPLTTVRVCNWDDPIADNANVARISHNQSLHDSCTRIKAYGTRRRFIVTVSSNDADSHMRLIKDWDSDLEELVKAYPERAHPNAPGYQPGMEFVFRRYQLPACFYPYIKLKDLPVVRSNGQRYPVQISVSQYQLTVSASGGYTGAKTGNWVLADGAKLELEQNYFILNKPALGLTSMSANANGDLLETWAEADVRITFAYEGDKHLVADTGQDYSSGIALPFAVDGLTEQIERDDLTYCQYTNKNTSGNEFGIYGADGQRKYFNAQIYNLDSDTWTSTLTNATVVQDDSRKLEAYAREQLRSRNRVHHSYTITIPWFTRGYEPGYRIAISNQTNGEALNLVITNVSWTSTLDGDHSTELTVDNIKPPHRSKLDLKGGGR